MLAVRAYVRLTPLSAKDDDHAPVRRAIWKPTPKIISLKCSLVPCDIKTRLNLLPHEIVSSLTAAELASLFPLHLRELSLINVP